MDKLLPCPFCGGNPIHHEKHASVVKCSSSDICPSSLGWVPVETWNTRYTPEGWQLVPVEPNEEMLDEGCESRERGERRFGRNKCQIVNNIYEDMLSAAPKWGGE